MKIISRILCFLPVAIIFLIWSLLLWIRTMILYVRYGGEFTVYRKGQQANMERIYEALTKQIDPDQ